MLRADQILIDVNEIKDKDISEVKKILARKIEKLSGPQIRITHIEILKKSIDARKKPQLFYSFSVGFSVEDEKGFLKKNKSKKITEYKNKEFKLPEISVKNAELKKKPPVIVGFGPAGIAAAYTLAKLGHNPIVIERGGAVDERVKRIEDFWQAGKLDSNTNVQFGEGGAGAFSDGKLSTGNKDKDGLKSAVLKVLVKHGAPENILYDAKPHIGTDLLREVVKNLREEIISLGGSVFFNTCLTKINFTQKNGEKVLSSVCVQDEKGEREIETGSLILAIGHSARDTFFTLNRDFNLISKPFAVGYRVVHEQAFLDRVQYGEGYEKKGLPPTSYKLTYTAHSGRPVFSFCMCPGGFVVDSRSAEGMLCVNGMSYSLRAGKYANSAIVMGVLPEELKGLLGELNVKSNGPLSGLIFQEEIERRAFETGKGAIPVCGDLLSKINPKDAFKGGIYEVPDMIKENLILPKSLNFDFNEAMTGFSKYINDFNENCMAIAGVESRTSSPVRIPRGDNFESLDIKGVFPCGEGAGYAGGIMSAAMDGVRCAIFLIANFYK